MKKYVILSVCFLLTSFSLKAQFEPPAGVPGTSAIYKDSSLFTSWATGCTIVRGYQDVSNTSLGYATAGDSSMALGIAGSNGIVSLGDGGIATLTFAQPITNGPGWDFAVFENSFDGLFLELAFVEVSSDGVNFFRFPATSNTQDTAQVASFGLLDATQLNNLAGKYAVLYGTPFDLDELENQQGLDVNAITHVRVIDVVGSIQSQYATYDSNGNPINDPWSTPFISSGFDLDAVGVIHQLTGVDPDMVSPFGMISVFPQPVTEQSQVGIELYSSTTLEIQVVDYTGRIIASKTYPALMSGKQYLPVADQALMSGSYVLMLVSEGRKTCLPFIVSN
jgi:hypothetical protein